MKKLVRDNIPAILKKNNLVYKAKVLINDRHYLSALHEKLIEEVDELIEASNTKPDEKVKEEVADVLEVVNALCQLKNYDLNEIETYRLRKKEQKGGFEKRIFLFLED